MATRSEIIEVVLTLGAGPFLHAMATANRETERLGTTGDRAMRRVGDEAQRSAVQVNSLSGSLRNLVTLLAGSAAAAGLAGLIASTIQAKSKMDDLKLSVATVVASTHNIADAQGRMLDGSNKITAALAKTSGLFKQLQTYALLTTATTEELATALQSAISPAAAVGLSLEQTMNFTVRVVQAMAGMKIPLEQASQEIRGILTGDMNPDSRINSGQLRITKEQIEGLRQQGKLYETLMDKLKDFGAAGDRAGQSMSGLGSSLKDVIKTVQAIAGEKATTILQERLKALLGWAVRLNKEGVNEINPALVKFGEDAGRAIAYVTEVVAYLAGEMAKLILWVQDNQSFVIWAGRVALVTVAVGYLITKLAHMVIVIGAINTLAVAVFGRSLLQMLWALTAYITTTLIPAILRMTFSLDTLKLAWATMTATARIGLAALLSPLGAVTLAIVGIGLAAEASRRYIAALNEEAAAIDSDTSSRDRVMKAQLIQRLRTKKEKEGSLSPGSQSQLDRLEKEVGTAAGNNMTGKAETLTTSKKSLEVFLTEALKFNGKPYKWGGGHNVLMTEEGPVDCSGLVEQAAKRAGLGNGLTGTAATQEAASQPVPMSEIQRGDLLFKGKVGAATHVAIYMGNGEILEAPRKGKSVAVRKMGAREFDRAGRIFTDGGDLIGSIAGSDRQALEEKTKESERKADEAARAAEARREASIKKAESDGEKSLALLEKQLSEKLIAEGDYSKKREDIETKTNAAIEGILKEGVKAAKAGTDERIKAESRLREFQSGASLDAIKSESEYSQAVKESIKAIDDKIKAILSGDEKAPSDISGAIERSFDFQKLYTKLISRIRPDDKAGLAAVEGKFGELLDVEAVRESIKGQEELGEITQERLNSELEMIRRNRAEEGARNAEQIEAQQEFSKETSRIGMTDSEAFEAEIQDMREAAEKAGVEKAKIDERERKMREQREKETNRAIASDVLGTIGGAFRDLAQIMEESGNLGAASLARTLASLANEAQGIARVIAGDMTAVAGLVESRLNTLTSGIARFTDKSRSSISQLMGMMDALTFFSPIKPSALIEMFRGDDIKKLDGAAALNKSLSDVGTKRGLANSLPSETRKSVLNSLDGEELGLIQKAILDKIIPPEMMQWAQMRISQLTDQLKGVSGLSPWITNPSGGEDDKDIIQADQAFSQALLDRAAAEREYNEGALDDYGNKISFEKRLELDLDELREQIAEDDLARSRRRRDANEQFARDEQADIERIAGIKRDMAEREKDDAKKIKEIMDEGVARRQISVEKDKAARIQEVRDEQKEYLDSAGKELREIADAAELRRRSHSEAIAEMDREDAKAAENADKQTSRLQSEYRYRTEAHKQRLIELDAEIERQRLLVQLSSEEVANRFALINAANAQGVSVSVGGNGQLQYSKRGINGETVTASGLIVGTPGQAGSAILDELSPEQRRYYGFSRGGIVPGFGDRDTVPAMLTPGEMVIPKSLTRDLMRLGLSGLGSVFSPTVIIQSPVVRSDADIRAIANEVGRAMSSQFRQRGNAFS